MTTQRALEAARVLPPLAEPGPPLSPERLRRYARHLTLPELGEEGQRRLANSRVLSVGAGGLGSPLLLYLAAAGVGTIGVVDDDRVDESNLHRQVLHGESDLGRLKVDSARDAVAEVNPYVELVSHPTRLDASNALDVVAAYDLVVDGSDNFPTRYLVNDACVLTGVPWVWGSILRFDGQVSVFWPAPPANGPCYRCIHPVPPPPGLVPSCADGGVLGVLPGVVGTIQAMEAIKLLAGIGESLVGRLLVYDALAATWQTLNIGKDEQCAACGAQPSITGLDDFVYARDDVDDHDDHADGAEHTTMRFGRRDDATGPGTGDPITRATISVHDLAEMRARGDDFMLVDVREPFERQIVAIEGAELVPMRGFLDGSAVAKLPRDTPVVLFCHVGNRSARALQILQDAGFDKACHVAGGITAWAREIETDKPTY